MSYNCIIVDDEPLAQDVLENFVGKIPGINLVAKCNNAIEALEALKANDIDLMFLDIQMPEITGLDFLKSLQKPPAVIFTTAYSEYALEGFNLDAIDYLLKPISFDRFLKSINKVTQYLDLQKKEEHASTNDLTAEDDYIFVKADKKIVKIKLSEILYIEGLKDYVMIYTPGKRIITLQTMKKLEEFLPASKFMRIHRSFIISIDKIKAVVGNNIELEDKLIPIGKFYKEAFMQLIEKHNLIK